LHEELELKEAPFNQLNYKGEPHLNSLKLIDEIPQVHIKADVREV
jgi:hypothetical protein